MNALDVDAKTRYQHEAQASESSDFTSLACASCWYIQHR